MLPSIVFDKSFLQSLTLDEAVMLDHFFSAVITQVFFAETLANLEKGLTRGRTPEQLVGSIAERTPIFHSYVSVPHRELILGNLLGHHVEMRGRPVVGGGIPVDFEGKNALVHQPSPEERAFARWQDGKFLEVERSYAKEWREELLKSGLQETTKAVRGVLGDFLPKSLTEARQMAASTLDVTGVNYRILQLALDLFKVRSKDARAIVSKWKKAGSMPIRKYAPYAAFCMEVDLFFYFAMANGLISDQRSSNRIDFNYLYYIPFCHVFVSSDKLHRSAVPLLQNRSQSFVWGPDLKAALARTNAYLAQLPESEKALGLVRLASYPPEVEPPTIQQLWDKHVPQERERSRANSIRDEALSTGHGALMKELQRRSGMMMKAAKAAAHSPVIERRRPPDHVLIERRIPAQRGSWRIFSEDIEQQEHSETG